MSKKKTFNLKEQYLLSWKYVKESKNFIYFIFGVFSLFALIGFFVPISKDLSNLFLEFIRELMKKTSLMSQGELVRFIFLNNLNSSFFGMVLGFFLGIFPVIVAVLNGYVLGFVALQSVHVDGISVLWKLLPHGVFELPAVFISLGLGLKLGTFIFKKRKLEVFRNYFLNSLWAFLFIILPLLIIAAIIEGGLIFLLR